MKPLQLFYFLGLPFSPFYALAMSLRSYLYKTNLLRSSKLSVPVISIGNLTMGGSGKTPTVQMVAKFLLDQGYKPGVISRGYGGKADNAVNIVSDGTSILMPVEQAGDEPFMLARSIPGLVVLTGKKRSLPAQYAQDHLGCNILVLDDGFQHMAVQRDIDIVLFNATTLAGNNRVFPGGDLREPYSALARADLFLLTGITGDNIEQATLFKAGLNSSFPKTPVFTTENHVDGVYDQNDSKLATQNDRLDQPLYAMSGIANPERFTQLLKDKGIELSGHLALKDHISYSQELIEEALAKAKRTGAKGIITTHKDLVKIEDLDVEFPLYCLKISSITSDNFFEFLSEKLSRHHV